MERTPTFRQQNWSGGLGNSGRIITALVLCVVIMVVIFGYVAATAGHDEWCRAPELARVGHALLEPGRLERLRTQFHSTS